MAICDICIIKPIICVCAKLTPKCTLSTHTLTFKVSVRHLRQSPYRGGVSLHVNKQVRMFEIQEQIQLT